LLLTLEVLRISSLEREDYCGGDQTSLKACWHAMSLAGGSDHRNRTPFAAALRFPELANPGGGGGGGGAPALAFRVAHRGQSVIGRWRIRRSLWWRRFACIAWPPRRGRSYQHLRAMRESPHGDGGFAPPRGKPRDYHRLGWKRKRLPRLIGRSRAIEMPDYRSETRLDRGSRFGGVNNRGDSGRRGD